MALLLTGSMQGQISFSVHLGTPPAWGPSGYSDVRYYYLPDVEAYYDVQTSMFIYISGNRWIHRTYLPDRYRNYDLYHGYKVVMNDYHGNSPYSHFREHRMKYAKGYRGREQHNIGERDNRRINQENDRNRNQNSSKEQMKNNDNNNNRGNNKNDKREKGHDNGNGNGNGNRK